MGFSKVLIGGLLGLVWLQTSAYSATPSAKEAINSLKLEYALTVPEQRLGLQNRKSLCQDCGMFFHFREPKVAEFWMKNVRFPLDIIFISPEGEILNIESAQPEATNDLPESKLTRYRAKGLTRAVIEVNQGWSARHGVRPGARIDIVEVLRRRPR